MALLIPQDYCSCSEYFVNHENSKDSAYCAKNTYYLDLEKPQEPISNKSKWITWNLKGMTEKTKEILYQKEDCLTLPVCTRLSRT